MFLWFKMKRLQIGVPTYIAKTIEKYQLLKRSELKCVSLGNVYSIDDADVFPINQRE